MATRKRRSLPWRFAWSLIGVIGFFLGVVAFVRLIQFPDTHESTAFTFDGALTIERTAPGGTEYTVNTSLATFDLDIADDDQHCGKLFRHYGAALSYCQKAGLPVVPSVHLVQGKCKQFDDGLTTALELAVQRGLPSDSRLGKQAALERLLSVLLTHRETSSGADRSTVDAAAVHVAVALTLGGVEPQVPPRLAKRVAAAEAGFLEEPAAKPLGPWVWSDPLKALWRQDRFLSGGMRADSPEAVVLSATISGDPVLAEAFRRFRAFGAKLTNRPVYVPPGQVGAPPEACVSFDAIAELLGSTSEATSEAAIDRACTAAAKRFGKKAGFALVAHSASKEYSLLASLGAKGAAADTMGLIIDAIKTGRLKLEPQEDSGWYDYQWYALETLLRPGKAQEAAKQKLSAAYKKRLEEAFRTSLTKHRETHIKRLPYFVLSSELGADPEDPEKIEIGPEFSAEPLSTVYLRYARAYRFLRNAMRGVLGEDFLKSLHRANEGDPAVEADLDAELHGMALLLYGLYGRICLELGQHPEYLPDELGEDDVAAANSALERWLVALADDPDLARDTRVAVPIATRLDGRIRYWATGGVRLQRVVYEYDQRPVVTGNVEASFVATHYYLPTDLFLEFERLSAEPLTRAEYRDLCNGRDEDALRSVVGVPRPGRFPWPACLAGVAVLMVAASIGWRFRNRLYPVTQALQQRCTRRVRRGVILAAAVCLALWVAAFVCFKGYRTKLLVRYVARIDVVAVLLDARFSGDHSSETIAALVELHDDDNPQTRYLASRYLEASWPPEEEKTLVLKKMPSLKDQLQAAAADPIPDVAANSVLLLDYFNDRQNVDFLLDRLQSARRIDTICLATVSALAEIGDPRALAAVIPMSDDPRGMVRFHVAKSLGSYDDDRAAAKLAELVQSTYSSFDYGNRGAIEGIIHSRGKFDPPKWEPRFNTALLAAAANPDFHWNERCACANHITQLDLAAEAYALLISDASSPESQAYPLAALALVYVGHPGNQSSADRQMLADALEEREDLRRDIEAAIDDRNEETLVQLIQEATGRKLKRPQGSD